MSAPIALSLHPRDQAVEMVVRVLHPVEPGGAVDPKSGKTTPANFLQTIAIQLNEKTLLEGQLGSALAKNPQFRFTFSGAKAGDTFLVSCTDSAGRKFAQEIVVPVFRNP